MYIIFRRLMCKATSASQTALINFFTFFLIIFAFFLDYFTTPCIQKTQRSNSLELKYRSKPLWNKLIFATQIYHCHLSAIKKKFLLKAVVGNLFLATLGKNSIIIFHHIVIQGVWEKRKTSPLGLFSGFSKSDPWQETLANHSSFHRERALLLAVLYMHCACDRRESCRKRSHSTSNSGFFAFFPLQL